MMKKWLVAMSLSIFLLTGLSTSSFFLTNFLSKLIEKNEHSARQLNFALGQENAAALLYAWQHSVPGSQHWQQLAKKSAKNNGQVAYILAEFYLGKNLLSKNFNHNEKTLQPAAIKTERAMLWYQQAIRLNYPKASIALADLYFHQGNERAAHTLLNKLQVLSFSQYQGDDVAIEAIILTTKVAISIGDIELANSLLLNFSSLLQADKRGIALLRMIKKYKVLPLTDNSSTNGDTNGASCPNSIQFFATNLLHLAHVEQLVKRFKEQPLNDLVCFSPVRYISLSTLSCSTARQNAILCDESKLAQVADSVTSRYLAIMLPKGGANVHFGVLYFDVLDGVDVVEHEISHLLGFIDEYPLIKGHAKCRASQQQVFAQNIAVLPNSYQGKRSDIREQVLKQLAWAAQIKKTTPILQLKVQGSPKSHYWQLGTPEKFALEVGLFRASTCDNNSAKQQNTFNAFKALSHRTKLQYDELNFPKQYIALLQNNSQQLIMPSFHYNIALAYYQQNKMKQATAWLEQAASWESDIARRRKVRQGGF